MGAKTPARSKTPGSEHTAGYDQFKEFEGQRYTGMKVGGRHKWYYDQGEWKEQKITPDLWQFTYEVQKRRAGRAPEGSGVPVGTAYHWYIAAHQVVRKLNANDYSTSMTGLKFKVAHQRADRTSWSASELAQRRRLIAFLQDLVRQLEEQNSKAAASKPSKKRVPSSNGRASARTGSRSRRRIHAVSAA